MRKVIVGTFVSLDGVMQGPGGPDEDKRGGFCFSGWLPPFETDRSDEAMNYLFGRPFDLLLGRRTYDIFSAYWPHVPKSVDAPGYSAGTAQMGEMFDACAKHVATHRPDTLDWENSHALGADVAAGVRALKATGGPDLVVQGSSELVRLLLGADLVDEIQLITYPVMLGRGVRLFNSGAAPHTLNLTYSKVTDNGVVIARYARGGEVRTGSFIHHEPSEAELQRRKEWWGG